MKKIKRNNYRTLPTFHIQVTWYKHTYFCSKMAISIGITKPVSKPKNGAKNAILHPIQLQNTKNLMENTI